MKNRLQIRKRPSKILLNSSDMPRRSTGDQEYAHTKEKNERAVTRRQLTCPSVDVFHTPVLLHSATATDLPQGNEDNYSTPSKTIEQCNKKKQKFRFSKKLPQNSKVSRYAPSEKKYDVDNTMYTFLDGVNFTNNQKEERGKKEKSKFVTNDKANNITSDKDDKDSSSSSSSEDKDKKDSDEVAFKRTLSMLDKDITICCVSKCPCVHGFKQTYTYRLEYAQRC